MQDFLIRILVLSVSIYIVGKFTRLYQIGDFWSAIVGAFFLAIINSSVRWIIVILTFPVTILTLGLFLFFINGFTLMISAGVLNVLQKTGDSYGYFTIIDYLGNRRYSFSILTDFDSETFLNEITILIQKNILNQDEINLIKKKLFAENKYCNVI